MENNIKNDEFQSVIVDEIPYDYLCGTAECLKVIANPTRLQIILHIMKGDFTVTEISHHCEISHAQTSGHLRLMEGKGAIKQRASWQNSVLFNHRATSNRCYAVYQWQI